MTQLTASEFAKARKKGTDRANSRGQDRAFFLDKAQDYWHFILTTSWVREEHWFWRRRLEQFNHFDYKDKEG